MECTRCKSEDYVKAGFRKTAKGEVQKYICKDCGREFTGQEKFHRLTDDKKELIFKIYKEKGEQRKIARIIGVHLRAVQYHLKKTPNI